MLNFFHKRKSIPQHTRFGVPAPDPFENPLVETHPGQLRQWAAGLPFANPQQLAEAVITSLSRLNRFPGQVKRREELMEVYLHPSNRLYHVSSEQKNPLPIRLKRQLMQEMAYGYLHLVNACLKEHSSEKMRSRLAGFIYFTIKFIALEYLFACEDYDCRTTSSRKELMRLFSLAEDLKLHNAPQDDPDQPVATISHQTKLILLLSLLDPCHLQQGESRVVFDYLKQFAEIARFLALDARIEVGGYYVIDRLGEVPPQQLDPDGIEGLTPSRFCLFDVIPISQQLHQHLRIIEQQNAKRPTGLQGLSAKMAANLVRRMLKSWHIRLQRDSERHETSGQIRLTLGLQAIYYQLSAEKDALTPTEHDSLSVTIEAGGMSGQAVNNHQPLDSWRFNQSRSGVALHLNLPIANPPQVGEIALLAKPDSNKREEMKLGIIRRALLKEDTILELGLQFVNGRIVPLSIQALDVEKDQEPVNLPALYIDFGSIERSTLLIPKDLMQIGREYRVEEMIPAPVISPTHLSEITASFERYRVARV
ncbi:MAG: flavoprotein [Pseudomonadota bacterium]